MAEITLPDGTVTHVTPGITIDQLFRGKPPPFGVELNGRPLDWAKHHHTVLDSRDRVRCQFNRTAEIKSGLYEPRPEPKNSAKEFYETPEAEALLMRSEKAMSTIRAAQKQLGQVIQPTPYGHLRYPTW